MRKIIAGNWKMNGNSMSVTALLKAVADITVEANIIVFPSYVYLPLTQHLLHKSKILWGAQNIAPEENGAFTGEIAGNMLKDFGCQYVLVGHSERRSLFAESNNIVAQKFIAAQRDGLIPMLCVGETQEQRQAGETEQVVSQQIDAVLQAVGISAFENAVIAYEPVWAIGTGLTATPEQAQEVHQQIREQIAQKDAKIASQLSILYGGSVKPDNATELFAQPDIDGGLVGGASLDAKSFKQICEA
jgi:triosephosphate isomerase